MKFLRMSFSNAQVNELVIGYFVKHNFNIRFIINLQLKYRD